MSLRHALLLRGACNLVFALYLLSSHWLGQAHGLVAVGCYALADGLLGLALSVTLARDLRTRWLLVLTAIDALVRLAFGAMLVSNPGAGSSVLLGAFLSSLTVVAFIALGMGGMALIALAAVWRARSAQVNVDTARIGAKVACIASVLALLLGLGLIAGMPGSDDRRAVIAAYALAVGLLFVVTGLRHRL